MPLVDVRLTVEETPLPRDVVAFLHEADRRIERFRQDCRIPGFIPSDYVRVYSYLRALADADVRPGALFCEWGSGLGVIACLAAMLDFDACGIEIEGELVEAARQLAEDFDLPVEFIQGSFIPPGGASWLRPEDGFVWLSTESDDSHEELGLEPADFDVIFAYPWPDEEHVIERLFEEHARVGALLLTYRGEKVALQRKTAAKRRR
jgi:hypothetical protein